MFRWVPPSKPADRGSEAFEGTVAVPSKPCLPSSYSSYGCLMKVYIDRDERYPDYAVFRSSGIGREVEVPAEAVERWEFADRLYEVRLKEIAEYFSGEKVPLSSSGVGGTDA
jgi:hypothetical protein